VNARTSVIGIGNILLGDDGVGVQVARGLAARYTFPPHVEILDGGTLGLDLIAYVCETERLLVIDAAKTGAPPGTITVFRGGDVPAVMRSLLSAHEASLCDLLAALTLIGKMPEQFVTVGIEPQVIAPSLDLSPAVRSALVLAELRRWDIGVLS
jgi:hydrogenase maturation protease